MGPMCILYLPLPRQQREHPGTLSADVALEGLGGSQADNWEDGPVPDIACKFAVAATGLPLCPT